MTIPIARPLLGDAELAEIGRALESGWVAQGPRVAEFERRFAGFCGAAHGVATTSCTTAMHLAVTLLGAGPGDEVLVPAFTWVATPNVVEYVGATPVFCDIELESFNVDPAALEAAVTPRTVGILPVHLFGRCADMEAVGVLARRHGLWVLEDAACGFGAHTASGAHAGTLGEAGCFSFHPRKALTTGEGGMLVTDDDKLAERARVLRDHGASRTDLERHGTRGGFLLPEYAELGFNYRMTDLQGALGCAQMDRAEAILAERRRLAARYDEALAGLDWLRLPVVPEGEEHGYQAYVCLYERDDRDALMAALEAEGIATRPGTHAPVETALYRDRYDLPDFPNARRAERQSLALPLFAGMTDGEQDRVVDALLRHGA